jgi:LPXTG-site transpeptidase (sortase) family protein
MRVYAYLAEEQDTSNVDAEEQSSPLVKKRPLRLLLGGKKLPLLLILVGVVLFTTAGWPVIEWQLIQAYDVAEGALIKAVVDLDDQGRMVANPSRPSQFGQLLLPPDLGTLDKPPAPLGGFDKRAFINEFFLSVPKLNIHRALVKVDSESFDKWLAHYPGSSLPGEDGNVFISGHSVLEKFYNPNDYKAIFSTIHTLEAGDEIIAEVGGVEYRYLVRSKRLVAPQEVSVIKPPAPGKFLSLLTCNPPGTYLRRLIVLAERAE